MAAAAAIAALEDSGMLLPDPSGSTLDPCPYPAASVGSRLVQAQRLEVMMGRSILVL